MINKLNKKSLIIIIIGIMFLLPSIVATSNIDIIKNTKPINNFNNDDLENNNLSHLYFFVINS